VPPSAPATTTYGAGTIKKAWAAWEGGIKDGGGTISTETGVLKEAPYGFKSRFENGKSTNPEEPIGAAHAGCFSMALPSIGLISFFPLSSAPSFPSTLRESNS